MKQDNVMANFLAKNVEGIGCDTCSAVMGLVQKETLANEVCSLNYRSTDN